MYQKRTKCSSAFVHVVHNVVRVKIFSPFRLQELTVTPVKLVSKKLGKYEPNGPKEFVSSTTVVKVTNCYRSDLFC